MNIHRALHLSLVALLFVGVPEDEGCCFQANPITGQAELVCSDEVLGPEFFPACVSLASQAADGGGFINTQIIIADISSPAVPIVAEADDDPKDIKRRPFKKFPGEQKTKRLMLKSKRDDGAARLYYDFVFSGSFGAELVVGIDDVANLTDGSTAFFSIAPAEGAGEHVRVTVTWDAATGMLLVGARDQNGPLGEATPFSPTLEIYLSISWYAFNGLNVIAYSNEGGYYEYLDQERPPPDGSIKGALGVENLGKKARYYFSNLSVNAPEMVIEAGVVRAALAGAGALQMVEEAWNITLFEGAPGSVSGLLAKTTEALTIAQQELQAAVDSGGSLAPAQTQLAFGSIKKGLKRAAAADKLALKLLAKNKLSNGALEKRVNKTRWACRLLLAQLYGFKSKSIDKLFATVIFEL